MLLHSHLNLHFLLSGSDSDGCLAFLQCPDLPAGHFRDLLVGTLIGNLLNTCQRTSDGSNTDLLTLLHRKFLTDRDLDSAGLHFRLLDFDRQSLHRTGCGDNGHFRCPLLLSGNGHTQGAILLHRDNLLVGACPAADEVPVGKA